MTLTISFRATQQPALRGWRAMGLMLWALAVLGCRGGDAQRDATSRKQVTASATAIPSAITVSAIPDENPTALMRRYQPLVRFLEKTLGVAVKYHPVTDYGAAVQALAAGKVDLAWLGGFTHLQARQFADVEPLCMREIDRRFQSVIVASTASAIKNPADLVGKTFAFGSKSSTSGHLMPRHFLNETFKLVPERDFAGELIFSGSHDATVKLVASGKVAAGAVNSLVFQRLKRENKVDQTKVEVIWTSPPYVDYVWTARRSLAPTLRRRFVEGMLSLDASNPADRRVLALQDAKKFVAAKADDFAALEKIAVATGLLKPLKN